ncbi:hypothetical protein AB0H36_11650 [Kribbella sp. NPDC050820]|uniref:hypothetical protein n=1 Tax=Kribbella sp. NPDC050820 TaxID=3155408 RepID=UPI0033C46B02
MIYDDNRDRPPFNPIWLADEPANSAAGLPYDEVRSVVERLATEHPNWEPAQIKLEIERPPRGVDYGLPRGVRISEQAIRRVVSQLRQRR